MYTPRPIDTSAVSLPPELVELTERLAEHIHDIWSQQKLLHGWRLGPTNVADKTHGSLVAYDELPDSEKQYDRATSMETIKALLALGYSVKKQEH